MTDEILPDAVAKRVLTRASELDVARRTGAQVSALREAAAQAGISEAAFDAALVREEETSPKPTIAEPPRWRNYVRNILAVALVVGVALSFVVIPRAATPPGAVATASLPMTEEAILLRCLSPGEAAELIRPFLGPENTVTRSEDAPRVLKVVATPDQHRLVKAEIDRVESTAGTCTTPRPSQ